MEYPKYDHRIFASSPEAIENFSDGDLIDSVGLSVEEAESILFQMQLQFEVDAGKLSDPINYATLSAVRNLLLDINTVVNWHLNNNVKKQGSVKT